MFDALGRSWRLAKQSLAVLRKDPELMVFPVISFITGVVIAGVLGGIGLTTKAFGENGITGLGVLFVFVFYFATYFATIYFQVALVAAVKLRLSGGNPTLAFGMKEANKRLGAIVTWAIIAAIVGLILRMLEEAARKNTSGWGRILAQVIIGLVGMAWSLATFFVIPVIAYEGVGGFEAIKRSAGIVKRRWGEAVVGQAGISLVLFILAAVVGVVLGVIGIFAIGAGGPLGLGVGIFFIALAVLGVLFLIALSATLQSIYTAVLYEFATTGRVGQEFSSADLNGAFQHGKQMVAD